MNPRLAHWKTRLCAELGVEPYTVCDDIRAVLPHYISKDGEQLPGSADMMISMSVPDDWPDRAVDLNVRQFFQTVKGATKPKSQLARALGRLVAEIPPWNATEPAP